MKKFYSLIAILLITGYIFAQTTSNHQPVIGQPPLKLNDSKLLNNAAKLYQKKSKSATDFINWFSNAESWVDSTSGDPTFGLNANFLFPDTNIRVQYLNGFFGPNLHGLAISLDPYAEIFHHIPFDKSKPYSVDSIEMYGGYQRHTKDNKGDTLIFQLVTGYNGFYSYLTDVFFQDELGVDTVKYLSIKFDPLTLMINQRYIDSLYNSYSLTPPTIYTYKYILTAADTFSTTALTDIRFRFTNVTPVKGQSILTVVFKPGYKYTVKDTLMRNKNWFRFLSYWENGAGTVANYSKDDWNTSYVISNQSIDPDPQQNGDMYAEYFPEWVYDLHSYPYQNHWIRMQLNQSGNTPPTNEIEGFETNSLSKWGNSSDFPWVITDSTAYKNTYSARSGFITGIGQSALTISLTADQSDSISFYSKTRISTTDNNFTFSIDGTTKSQTNETIDWKRFAFPVSAGYHTMSWIFNNSSSDYHYDCAWLDNISFPPSKNLGITENPDKSVKLYQNIPNPANNSTIIKYDIKGSHNINLQITDITGRVIINNSLGKQNSGIHTFTLNTSNLASGLYYYTLKVDNSNLTKKMIINN